MLIDVHTHITDKKFDEDIEEVIENSNCAVIINNGMNVEDNRKTIELGKKFSKVKVALGIHPYDIVKMDEKDIEAEIKFIAKQKIIAIGEIGLDFTYEEKEKQIKYFKEFLGLAKKMDLPVLVHSRKAEKEVVEILKEKNMKKVVMHCYCGKLEVGLEAEKLGFYFSIPPRLITNKEFQELVKKISITRILTETDAPYMGAEKGKRNEPGNVKQTVRKIAEIKGMSEEEVENSIFMNYQKLFS
ncbi:TatD family hydrolase [archaeon]|nr:TatD family hydrolase [archaeon]MBT3730619.1 TatD family hydrolase [archaeon]MBT4669521.1 TatD family hydrolase [archaeon]MBT7052841.1 TatD family hydrolase [archaeon]MBT8010033.1 TatD family hydrolase [archaeon]